MYSEKLESLIDAILADGVIEDNEMAVLKRAAEKEGEDPDELEIVIKGRLAKMQRANAQAMPPMPETSKANAKYGNVKKCPSCGAQIIGGTAKCPECGFNFSGIQVNSSAQRLANELQKLVEKEKKSDGSIDGYANMVGSAYDTMMGKQDPKVALIENFPIPNTREDLLEFLTSLQPKAKKPNFFTRNSTMYALSHAYWKLYGTCLNKARISYANDPDFNFFFEDYKKR